jgi:hypothetical protein
MGSLGLKALFFLAKNGHAWDHGRVLGTNHYGTLLCLVRARLCACDQASCLGGGDALSLGVEVVINIIIIIIMSS